jgi:hypothetical protein
MPISGGPPPNDPESQPAGAVNVASPPQTDRLERAQLADLVRRTKAEPRRDGRAINAAFPPEIRAAVEAEWRAGIRPVSSIASDLGVSRELVYRWANQYGWPARRNAMQAARERIDAALINRAVAEFRRSAGDSRGVETGSSNDAAASNARSDVAFETYAVVVAEVVERQRRSATQAVNLGAALLEIQQAAIGHEKARETAGAAPALRELQTLISGYSSLIRGLAAAIALQRRSFGLDTDDEGAQTPFQPGSYDEIVREAEARGESLT